MQQHLAARQENSGLQLGAPVIPCVRAHPAPQYGPGKQRPSQPHRVSLETAALGPWPCPPPSGEGESADCGAHEALNRSGLLLSPPTSLGVTPTPQDKSRGHRGGEMLSA